MRELEKVDRKGNLSEKGATELRVLRGFKSKLRAEIKEMPTGQQLLDIDKLYYQELGVPMSRAGIPQMSTEVFHNRIATNLGNLTQARNFLETAGEDGVPVLKQAVYSILHGKAVKGNDVASEAQLNNWLSEGDNRQLAQLAGIDVADTVALLKATKRQRADLTKEYNNNAYQQTDDFLKTVGKGGVDSYVASLLKSSHNLIDFNENMKNMSPDSQEMFKTAMRAELMLRAMKNTIITPTGGRKRSASSFMHSKEHLPIYTAMFGKEAVN